MTEHAYAVVEVVDGDAEVATVTIAGDVPLVFVVDAVARLQLAAQQLGWSVRLRETADSAEAVHEAVGLCGLAAQLCRQPEGGEQRGVEEVVQLDEPPA